MIWLHFVLLTRDDMLLIMKRAERKLLPFRSALTTTHCLQEQHVMAIYDPTTPDELWYDIPSLPGYQFSSEFRVRKHQKATWKRKLKNPKWRIVRLSLSSRYLSFIFWNQERKRKVYLHRVIAELAYGFNGVGQESIVRHIDDNKLNNHLSNIAIGTSKDNSRDAHRNGRTPQGSRHWKARFTESDIREMRSRHLAGQIQAKIARDFKAPHSLVSLILRRLLWKHVI